MCLVPEELNIPKKNEKIQISLLFLFAVLSVF